MRFLLIDLVYLTKRVLKESELRAGKYLDGFLLKQMNREMFEKRKKEYETTYGIK